MVVTAVMLGFLIQQLLHWCQTAGAQVQHPSKYCQTAADILYKAKLNTGSVMEYTLALTNAALDKYCRKWSAVPKTSFIHKFRGGCTIIFLLGQQLHFELYNFSYQILNIAVFCLLSTWGGDCLGLSSELGSSMATAKIVTTNLAQRTLDQGEPIINLFAMRSDRGDFNEGICWSYGYQLNARDCKRKNS